MKRLLLLAPLAPLFALGQRRFSRPDNGKRHQLTTIDFRVRRRMVAQSARNGEPGRHATQCITRRTANRRQHAQSDGNAKAHLHE